MPNTPLPDLPPTAPVAPAPPAEPERTPFTTLSLPVVVPALLVLGALLVYCRFYPDSADTLFSGAQSPVVTRFDGFCTVAVTA